MTSTSKTRASRSKGISADLPRSTWVEHDAPAARTRGAEIVEELAEDWGAKEVAIDAFHHLVYAGATGVAYAALNR